MRIGLMSATCKENGVLGTEHGSGSMMLGHATLDMCAHRVDRCAAGTQRDRIGRSLVGLKAILNFWLPSRYFKLLCVTGSVWSRCWRCMKQLLQVTVDGRDVGIIGA